MIEAFNDVEVRGSGLVYSSTFEQIKKMYAVDPEKAGELAISAIELILTEQISSDDVMIDMLLAPASVVNRANIEKYDQKKESAKEKKIAEWKLREIVELQNLGLKQREIGERLGLSQQIVSYRLTQIKTNYPELLQTTYKNTKNSTNDTNEIQNTNGTNFVQICTEKSFVKQEEPTPGQQEKLPFRF